MKIKIGREILQKLVIVGILIFIGIILSILSSKFLTIINLNNVSRQVSFVIISGCAVTLLMISGNFDLSIGSIMGRFYVSRASGTLCAQRHLEVQ